ncbi:MAG TPA: Na+/H+ antiporter NhaA [Stellaceae bacterium]|nr:Na+/H+ antiporter NhaA [Stellaceae bacterium]
MLSERETAMSRLQQFMALESAGGIVLGGAALLAMILANSPLGPFYTRFLDIPLGIQIGSLLIKKPLLLWVNDGLMAVFFMLVGLEVKREVAEGGLSDRAKAVLPVIAALGGMAIPALIYTAFNWGNAEALRGWAIPTATDIAFALGVLSLLGSRVPSSLRLFLLAVAIIDDLGAIVIIAVFYSTELSWTALACAGLGVAVLAVLNLAGVARRAPYMLAGVFLWVCVLKSGIHATLAGVVVGMAVPLRIPRAASPLLGLEHDLHPWVAFGVLPVFAFANAGVRLFGITVSDLLDPIALGVAFGLILGKQFGIAGSIWLSVRSGLGSLPEGANWRHIYGLALLCGIGFTMSLFIGSLAFPAEGYDIDIRIAVLVASSVSALSGYLLLRSQPRPVQPKSTVTTS